MKTKALVIGVGNMGRHHARNYAALEGVELVGVVDANQELASQIATTYNCKSYSCLEEACGCGAQVASVCVPTSKHVEAAVPLLKAGVSVLIEKPIAPTEEEAEVIRKASEDSGAKVAVGHIERFNPAVAALKNLMESGRLGTIIQVMTRREGPNPDRIRDANIILDIGSHDIDIMNYLFRSTPVAIHASGGRFKRTDLEDYANLMLVYAGNGEYPTTGYIQVNWVTRAKVRRIEVTGSEGYASADLVKQVVTLHSLETPPVFQNYEEYMKMFGSDKTEEIPVEKAEPLKLELEQFVKWSNGQDASVVTLDEGLAAIRIAAYATNQIRIQKMAAAAYAHMGASKS